MRACARRASPHHSPGGAARSILVENSNQRSSVGEAQGGTEETALLRRSRSSDIIQLDSRCQKNSSKVNLAAMPVSRNDRRRALLMSGLELSSPPRNFGPIKTILAILVVSESGCAHERARHRERIPGSAAYERVSGPQQFTRGLCSQMKTDDGWRVPEGKFSHPGDPSARGKRPRPHLELMRMCLTSSTSRAVLGRVTVRTPLWNEAVTLSPSTSAGSTIRRSNWP